MKTKISELPNGLRALATLRANEYQDYLTSNGIRLNKEYDADILDSAFSWNSTPEKYGFWNLVNQRQYEKVITLNNNGQ